MDNEERVESPQEVQESPEVEFMTDEEHEALAPEEKDFRDFVGVDTKAKSNPAWDNKRFRQVYRKAKDSERKAEEKDKDFEIQNEFVKKLMATTGKIAESAEKIAETTTLQKQNDYLSEIETLERSISEMKTKRKEARLVGEWDIVDDLDEGIEKAKSKIVKKTEAMAQQPKEKKADNVVDSPLSTEVVKFIKENPWFDSANKDFDPVLYDAAVKKDNQLKGMDEWQGKSLSERFKEVKKYMEKRFPELKESDTPTNKHIVEGVGGEFPSGTNGTSSKIKLSDEQKRAAHRMLDHIVGYDKAEAAYIKGM
jgi:hypothetical protein